MDTHYAKIFRVHLNLEETISQMYLTGFGYQKHLYTESDFVLVTKAS